MNNRMKELEALKEELRQGEEKLRRAEHEIKRLEEKKKALTRKERTHRLCTHGALLDRFLPDPDRMSEEEVLAVLKIAFSGEETKRKLEEIISGRKGEISRTL